MKSKTFFKTFLASSLLLLIAPSSYGMQKPLISIPLEYIHQACSSLETFSEYVSEKYSTPDAVQKPRVLYQAIEKNWNELETGIPFPLAAEIMNQIALRNLRETKKLLLFLISLKNQNNLKNIQDLVSTCKKLTAQCILSKEIESISILDAQ